MASSADGAAQQPPLDPKIIELRKKLAARYAAAPASEKPQLRKCADCGEPVYDRKICLQTGLLHDLDKKIIVGGVAVDADRRTFTGSDLMTAINSIRIKWQAARVTKVAIDADAIGIFQTFPLQRSWQLMRIGICYGKFENGVVSIHSIYEPEQQGTALRAELSPDRRQSNVDRLAELLGLQRVGLVMTHPPRDSAEIVLAAQELLMCCREQSRFGDHCVLITVAPAVSETGTQHISAQAWQSSEQCVKLFQVGLLTEHPDDIRFVQSNEPLEVSQEETDAKGKRQCIIREPNRAVDCRWLTSYIAVESFASTVVSNRFIRISRPGEIPPTFHNLKIYFADPKRTRLNFVEKISDFHVLVFLMEHIYDVASDMPVIAQAVLTKDTSRIALYEEMLRERLKGQ